MNPPSQAAARGAPERLVTPYGPYAPQATRPTHATPIAPLFYDPEHRRQIIAQAAYFRSQRRGFTPGHELEDWLAAEAEVDTALLPDLRA
ncbi:MAG TPA: DUF2934 domain-containing protein [Steroidobacteraceae bacterium]|nr:DUF2934 domain-containing protein [Steroidobacteraceae bacterium]